LNFSGSPDVIDSLFLNGVAQFQGIWGSIGSGAEFTTSLLAGPGRLQVTNGPLAGDFNADGLIDSADYVYWRKSLGTAFAEADYNAWRKNFSAPSAVGSFGSPDSAPNELLSNVPEPSGWAFMLVAALGFAPRNTHPRRRAAFESCPLA
jgi:hypothetical protein